MKQCTKCLETKPLECFRKRPERTCGYRSQCKECDIKYSSLYAQNNKDKTKEYMREYSKTYRSNNKDKFIEYHKTWDSANPERYQASRKARKQRRRAREMQAQGSFSPQEWLDLCDYYGNICLACNEETKLTADHILPISKGGSNTIDNIQPLCGPCNSSKGTNIFNYKFWFTTDMAVL